MNPMALAKAVYARTPEPLQNVLVSLEGLRRSIWRYSGRQREWEAFFRRSAAWSEEELLAYQATRLRAMVAHAITSVPYYRRQLPKLGISAASIRSADDVRRLPMLERADLHASWRDLVAEGWPRTHLWEHPSGGSTGMPVSIVTSREAMELEYGFYWARRRPMVNRSDPNATFTGNPIVPTGRTRPPFWRDNWAARQRLYSVFHMSEKTLPAYVDDLSRRPLGYAQGYPSALYTIGEHMLRHGISIRSPFKAFFSTSEVLQPHYRETIERAFGCRVWDQYGQGEAAGSITEYACGHKHVDMDYGIIELHPVGEEEGLVRAEIVCTSLHNEAWPLFRYRVGDLALYDPDERCPHHPGPVIRAIEGRTSQFFELPDGRRINTLMGLSIHCRNTRSIQVVQEEKGAIVVHVVPHEAYGPDDEALLLRVFRTRLGDALGIRVVRAEAPILTARGKFLAIHNRLPREATESSGTTPA